MQRYSARFSLKAQLDGAWLGSFYVTTDVIDKESYSNEPCIRPGAACDWASEPRRLFYSRGGESRRYLLDRRLGGHQNLLSRWFLLAYSSTLKMKAICSSEELVDLHRTTRRYIPEDRTLHNHRCENLKS
jgi:hypothetical protein